MKRCEHVPDPRMRHEIREGRTTCWYCARVIVKNTAGRWVLSRGARNG